jgi:hypothetical protein
MDVFYLWDVVDVSGHLCDLYCYNIAPIQTQETMDIDYGGYHYDVRCGKQYLLDTLSRPVKHE